MVASSRNRAACGVEGALRGTTGGARVSERNDYRLRKEAERDRERERGRNLLREDSGPPHTPLADGRCKEMAVRSQPMPMKPVTVHRTCTRHGTWGRQQYSSRHCPVSATHEIYARRYQHRHTDAARMAFSLEPEHLIFARSVIPGSPHEVVSPGRLTGSHAHDTLVHASSRPAAERVRRAKNLHRTPPAHITGLIALHACWPLPLFSDCSTEKSKRIFSESNPCMRAPNSV